MNPFKRLLLAAVAAGAGSIPTPAAEPAETAPPAYSDVLTGRDCGPTAGGLTAGAGVYVMRARFDNNMAFGVQGTALRAAGAVPPGAPGTRLTQRIEIDHNAVAAPEVWLGYTTPSGWGGRVRYWYFREGTNQTFNGLDQGVNSTLLFSAAPLGLSLVNGTTTMVATSKLDLNVLDAEGQYNFRAAGWSVLLSAGIRTARIDQSYNAFVPQGGNNALLSSSVFTGAGPTLAAGVRHPLGPTCLSLYGSGRYSLAYGDATQRAGIPDQNLVATERREIGVGIAELEWGLEADREVGRARAFGQVGIVGQNWSGAGSASRSSVNVLPGGGFVGAAYTGDSDFNFLGLVVRLGLAY